MKCKDCRFRNIEGTLDICPRFGPRYMNGAVIVGTGGQVELIDCPKGEAVQKRAEPLVPSVSFDKPSYRALVNGFALPG